MLGGQHGEKSESKVEVRVEENCWTQVVQEAEQPEEEVRLKPRVGAITSVIESCIASSAGPQRGSSIRDHRGPPAQAGK
jgi:hypothetical protein